MTHLTRWNRDEWRSGIDFRNFRQAKEKLRSLLPQLMWVPIIYNPPFCVDDE